MAAPLAFNGVMWGADKVPDHWFEKIPGGFFGSGSKNRSQVDEKSAKSSKKKGSMKKSRSSRRYSDDEYDDDRSRRSDYDDGYRSDGHRDHGHRRSGQGDGHTRFDGGNDGGFDEINNRPRRQRSRAGRRDSDDRYGYGDGHRPPFRDTNPRQPRPPKEAPYPTSPRMQGPLDRPPMGYYAAPAAMGGAATVSSSSAYGSPAPGPHRGAQSTSSLRGGISTGYVPYAHIYGGPKHPPDQQEDFVPPPQSEQGSVQPNSTNQIFSPSGSRPPVQRPPAGYQQNPLAQEAPAGNQPGYLVDPNHNTHHVDDRQSGYDHENVRRGSRSPPRRRASRRESSRERQESPSHRRAARREHSWERHESPESRSGRRSGQRERSRHGDRGKSRGSARERYVDDRPRKPTSKRDPPQSDSRRRRASEHHGKDGYYSD